MENFEERLDSYRAYITYLGTVNASVKPLSFHVWSKQEDTFNTISQQAPARHVTVCDEGEI